MKQTTILLLMLLLADAGRAQTHDYPVTQVPFTDVKISAQSFWGQRLKAARDVTIPLAFGKCLTEGRYENFIKAAHPSRDYDVSTSMGFPFDDTDVYKTIEGASYILQTYPDRRLETYIDHVLDTIAAAQEPDGYLYTARTINPERPHRWSGKRRWEREEELSHELYNLGHMVDADCAHFQATGSVKFLNIARRYADCVVREVGPAAGQATVVPGHQIAEMALARLYVLTGEKRYIDEAKYLLDYRGKTSRRSAYSQSHLPVVDQKEAVGHAVRAGYMYAGMADVAALTGDSAFIRAIDAIWANITGRKLYLTGGVGARHAGEAFGDNDELPNRTAYNETCAAIAQVYLNHRMFLLHGDSKYVDVLERTLYNGLISGMSVDGGKFFYPNPLASDGQYKFNADGTLTRQPWFGCACCPSNLCRFIPSVPGYVYAVCDRDLFVNLFLANTATVRIAGKEVVLDVQTAYPWDGDIALRIVRNRAGRFTLKIRIPGWVRGEVLPGDLYRYSDGRTPGYTVTLNGRPVSAVPLRKGYLPVTASFKRGDVIRIHFDMEPRMVKADNKVAADRGRVALERGPIVYCAEEADNGAADLRHVFLPRDSRLTVIPDKAIRNTEGDGQVFKVTAIGAAGQLARCSADGKLAFEDTSLTFIPYYAWNHRGAGIMQVWMLQDLSGMEE